MTKWNRLLAVFVAFVMLLSMPIMTGVSRAIAEAEDKVIEDGDLTISKTVVNGDTDLAFDFELTVTMYQSTDPWSVRTVAYLYSLISPDGIFAEDDIQPVIDQVSAYLNGSSEPLDEISFSTTFTLKHGESVSVPMKAGTDYEITEEGVTGYTPSANGQTGTSGSSLTVSGTIDGDETVAFKNKVFLDTGKLTVGKSVVNGDPEQEFTFNLEIVLRNNPDDLWTSSNVSSIAYMVSTCGLFTQEDITNIINRIAANAMNSGEIVEEIRASKTFTLKDGESFEVPSLLGGTEYTITEVGTDGYTPSANGQTGTSGSSLTVSGTIDGDETVAFKNKVFLDTGKLTVGKSVVNGDPEQEFTFNLEIVLRNNPDDLWTSSNLSSISYMVSTCGLFTQEDITNIMNRIAANAMNSGEIVEEIRASKTFTLKDGESFEVPSLLGGTEYTITEVGTDGCTPAADGQTGTLGEDLTVTGTINGNKPITFTNTFAAEPIPVTIHVTGNGTTVAYTGTQQSFHTSPTFTTDNEDLAKIINTVAGYSGQRQGIWARGTEVGTHYTNWQPSDFTLHAEGYDATFVIDQQGWILIQYTDELAITSGTESWEYDRTEHTNHEYTVTYGGEAVAADETGLVFVLPTGDTLTIVPDEDAKIKHVAENTVDNTFTYTLENEELYTVAEPTYGTLSVTPHSVTITVTGNTGTFPYDGEEHTVSGYSVASNSELFDTSDVSVVGRPAGHDDNLFTAKRTDVGITYMNMNDVDWWIMQTVLQSSNDNASDFDETITIVDGWIEITEPAEPIPVTIHVTGNGTTVAYTGTQQSFHTSPTFTTDNEDLADIINTVAGYSGQRQGIWARGTEVGTHYTNWQPSDFTLHAEGYDATFVIDQQGWILIEDSTPIKITSATNSWVHDGALHKDETYTVMYGRDEIEADETGLVFILPTGDTLTITPTAEGVKHVMDTQEGNNTFTYEITNGEGYTSVTATYGTLSITKRPVIVYIVGKTGTFPYDGEEHTVSGLEPWTSNDEYFVPENGFRLAATTKPTVKRTDVGKTYMELPETGWLFGQNTVGDHAVSDFELTFDVTDGWIEITKISSDELTELLENSITGYEGVYDAQPHGITVDMDALPEGTVIYYNAAEIKGWTTEAPTITNVVEGPLTVQVKAENPNYEDAHAAATITILPRPVTVNVVLSHYETEYTGETVSYRATITYMPQEDEILAATEGYDPHYGGGKNDYFVQRSEVGITYTHVDPEMFLLTDEMNGMSAEMLQNFDPTFNVEQGWLEITEPAEPIPVTIHVTGNGKTVAYTGTEQSFITSPTFTTDNEDLADIINTVARYSGPRHGLWAIGTEVGTHYTNWQPSDFTLDAEGYEATFVIDQQGWITIDGTDVYPAFKSQTLVLEGKIGVRFYMYLPQIDQFGYGYMDFQISGKDGENYATTEQFSTDPKVMNSKGYYGFTFYVNTIQMADTITATFHFTDNGEAATIQKTFTAKEYFLMFDDTYAAVPEAYSVNMANLIMATADLGHYVQAYLSDVRPEWSLENGDHAEMDKFYATYTDDDLADTTEAVASHAISVSGSNTDISKMTYKVNFESDMAIHMIIAMKPEYTGTLTATTEDGVECVITQQTATKYMVEVPNVQAHLLSHKYTIHITTDSGTLTVVGSGLSYAHLLLRDANGDPLVQNAAIAFYRYSKYADLVKEDMRSGR